MNHLKLAAHVPSMIKDFWSSDLNRRAVELVDPQPGERVLDIGAGMGAGAVVAAARVAPGGRVIAVDPSRAMRAVLRLRGRGPAARSVEVRAGSAEALPVDGENVDVAYAVNAVHHFADLAAAAAEMTRVLRPGGRVVLVEEDMTHPEHPWHFLSEGSEHGPHTLDGAQLLGALTDAGLAAARSKYLRLGDTPATVFTAARPS